MVSKRYLIYFSYIGTSFRGVQRQVSKDLHDPSTVQGLLDYALESMKPKNKPTTLLASRTDQGVHALKSACTVDLDFHIDLGTNYMTHFLNKFFDSAEIPIRISNILWIPWEFNARKSPLWRKYVYRFAILKPNFLPDDRTKTFTLPIPITEFNRCHFVRDNNFNFDEVVKACEVFIGPQDYIAFLGKPQSTMHDENLQTIRLVHRVFIEKAHPYLPSDLNDCFDYYHLTVEGKSFIYNQVRKMVAIILAIGQGKIFIEDVQQMFINPSPASWPHDLAMVPSCGLYLADIFYDPKELELPKDIKEEVKNPPRPTKKELERLVAEEEKITRSLKELKKKKNVTVPE